MGNNKEECPELRRGPWTLEEDTLLAKFISCHGQGRWNVLAKNSGLRRTGKSCRMRWLNYLKPGIKRGDLSPQEQLLILELHSRWGNRWSKIAECLPGRTDNEIKNYWRTQVLKQARLLKIDANSIVFQDIVRCTWIPTPIQTTEEASASSIMELGSSTAFCRSSPTPTALTLGYVSYEQEQTSLATAAAPPSPGPSQGSQKKFAGHSETFQNMDDIGNRSCKLYNSSSLNSISPALSSTSISLDRQISDYRISTSTVADNNNISCCNSVSGCEYCYDHVDNNNSSYDYNQMWIQDPMDNNLEGNLWNLDELWWPQPSNNNGCINYCLPCETK